MSVDLDLPLERYGLIADLAARMAERGYCFGKTALQKLVYFLQELYGVDCDYTFTLYTYGPFESMLLADLDAVAALEGVQVTYQTMGYQISPGAEVNEVREYAADFLKENGDSIQAVVDEFGGMSAKTLELYATVVYVERDAWTPDQEPSIDHVLEVVYDLKPHFSEDEIRAAIESLVEKGHIQVVSRKAARIARPSRSSGN